jgi:hypothetical protein
MAGRLAAAGTTSFFAAAIVLVDGRPGSTLGLLLGHPAGGDLVADAFAGDFLLEGPDVCPFDCGIAIAPPPPLLCDGLTSPRCVGGLSLSGRRRAIRKGTNHDPCNRKIA